MPLYEYICEEDGTVVELMRPMDKADDPVEDPEGRGRVFRRRLSSFMPRSGQNGRTPPSPPAACPCGKPGGTCAMR
jgi:putative FmdB family regulatory protein